VKENSHDNAGAVVKPSFRFKKTEHLAGKEAVRGVFNGGKRIGCPGAKLFLLKNDLEYNRICFTFPKKYGNAVERNRARRLGREAFRLLKPRLKGGFDMVLLVYPANDEPHLQDRMNQLTVLFTRAGLLREPAGFRETEQ
jgi:ribonuclease P protein component